MQFHETGLGRRFFESQLPKLIKELGRIADALEKQNELKEKEESDYENRSKESRTLSRTKRG